MTGPLHGLKVVELAGIGPGPFCAMFLADLGADVVRIDRPSGGIAAVEYKLDLLNRGKRSVALDLKTEVETALQLIEKADVLIEGFRPGVAERLGLGPSVCLERNPRLVYGRMTGWGQTGPRAHTAGHDITYIALAGALHTIGSADGPPVVPLNLLGDFGGGAMYLAAGILAALWETKSSGRGQVVDAAIVDGVAHLLTLQWSMLGGGAWRDERGVNLLDGGAPFYGVYETADGQHMAVGPLEPQFFQEMMSRLDLADEVNDYFDRERWGHLRHRIAAAFLSGTQKEWSDKFADSDGCVAPVLSMREAATDPHLSARGTYVEKDGVTQPAPAPRFSRTPSELGPKPPDPGEHSVEDVLADWS
ncbi:MAG TPA: carnitine dehydratase [Micromonosporaceae bacterium]|nr:carnitine dehydratase [Micromonosporaceae bacterium]HCU52067.1 carnitine dehydratase [Micromonosporaceae bacterium]